MLQIQEGPADLIELFKNAFQPGTGGIVTFAGIVRDDGMDKLRFEADIQEAKKQLNIIIEEAKGRWQLNSVQVVHRYGDLSLGEVIVLIVVGAGHRDAAFDGARYIIDELKKRVPIWKADLYDDSVKWKEIDH